jgi:hypothetical protein
MLFAAAGAVAWVKLFDYFARHDVIERVRSCSHAMHMQSIHMRLRVSEGAPALSQCTRAILHDVALCDFAEAEPKAGAHHGWPAVCADVAAVQLGA